MGILKHGLASRKAGIPKIYSVWRNIKNRCLNPNVPEFKHYGGRGVLMCELWINSFEAFFESMGHPPDGMTIDRIDNSKGYEPGNCQWVSMAQQARNRRSNLNYTICCETKCLKDWCHTYGVRYQMVRKRMFERNWPLIKALTYSPRITKLNRDLYKSAIQ